MCGRTFGMQSLRLIGRPLAGVARWRWPGPEVLLSLLLEKEDYTQVALQISRDLRTNQGSAPLMQITPTLKCSRVLTAFSVL